MSAQLALDLEAIVRIPLVADEPLRDRFDRFHAANPHVYRELVRLARHVRGLGFEQCGIALLFERMRWEWAIRTRGDRYTLNNDFRSRYARLIMDQEPDLEGFFVVRRLTA